MKRVGLVGAGVLGSIHLKYLVKNPDIDLVGVAESSSERVKELKKDHDIPFFSTYQELPELDCVLIVTPTATHYEIASYFISKGIHTFIEKPVASVLSDAKKLKQMADKSGSIVQIGHVERFNPVITWVEDKINTPRFIQAERLAPFSVSGRITDVGAILDLMIHDIDLVNAFVKSPLIDIETVGLSALGEKDDMAITRLKFQNGCYAILSVSRLSLKKERKMRIFQNQGYFSLDLLKLKVKSVTGSLEGGKLALKPLLKRFKRKETLMLEQKEFFNAVDEGRPPRVTLDDGIKALEIAEKIEEKIKEA